MPRKRQAARAGPEQPRADEDSAWKEALDYFFRAALAFFFLLLYEAIDWSRPPQFLDKELQKVTRDAQLGRRLADKLVKVWLKDGSEAWILIHIEVQGEKEEEFSQRMYIYHYRIYDRYRGEVISLAILTDSDPKWRPDSFEYANFGCEARLRFPTVKLLDYKDRLEELEQSTNPFALLTLAHLEAQSTARSPRRRLGAKLKLVKSLYEKGMTRQETLELLRLIDWMLALPKDLVSSFETTMEEYEKEKKVAYITSFERHGMERGTVLATRNAVLRVLRARFGELAPGLLERVNSVKSTDALELLVDRAATAGSLEEFSRSVPR